LALRAAGAYHGEDERSRHDHALFRLTCFICFICFT